MATAKLDVNNYIPAQKLSDINLDKGLYSGDIGLGKNFYLKSLYTDLIFIEYLDVNVSGQREEDGLIVPTLTNDMHWRKGIVRMVGANVSHTKVGDVVCFPNDKGLQTASVSFLLNGKIHHTDNGIFLDERRLFAKLGTIK